MQPMAANDSPGASLGLGAQAPTQCAPRQVFALAGAATVQTSRIVTPSRAGRVLPRAPPQLSRAQVGVDVDARDAPSARPRCDAIDHLCGDSTGKGTD
jgi:hypothetical protein